ncbi:hypothetical protein MJL48_28830, partial [Salmonella enterica subsp. enterica serovar Kentucky]|nr:hypothetical protein [Salmonella enterica subsp. enterica serovar Kentucky]
MSLKTIKYFSTLIVAVVAVLAAWWLWNYYMQSPWTRDGNRSMKQLEKLIIEATVLTEPEAEVERVMQVCNACRYCEGFCAV